MIAWMTSDMSANFRRQSFLGATASGVSPEPGQPIPAPKPEIIRPPTPLEEPQPDKAPDLPQPGPDVVLPPGPEVVTPPQPQEIPPAGPG
jgi:hypothetical protein